MPKVTVRIPSYNHEKYVKECLESVLNQTFQDFEIVITDDGSSDRTVDVIKEFTDPRIKLAIHDKNRGTACAIESCLKRAEGDYIANLCSDDTWEPKKLQAQVKFLDENPQFDAVFTKVTLIGEDSKLYNGNHFYTTAFDVENRAPEAWLRHFFYYGNCLCIPSVLIRRNVYEELHYQDKRMASLNDFDLWVRFSLKHRFFIFNEKLTNFRIRANEANASGNRIDNHIRGLFEYKQILNNYLNISDPLFILKVFPECTKYGNVVSETIPYFLGRLAIDTGESHKQLWGLEVIYNSIENDGIASYLESHNRFTYTDFYQLTAETDVFHLRQIRDLVEQEEKIAKLFPLRAVKAAYISMKRMFANSESK